MYYLTRSGNYPSTFNADTASRGGETAHTPTLKLLAPGVEITYTDQR